MKKIYNIDFTRLITWLFPPKLRAEILLNWLKALVSPISSLYNAWKLYYSDVAIRLSITSQVCSIEGYLNDIFDPVQRRITITDTLNDTVILIHKDEANLPLKLYIAYSAGIDNNLITVISDDSNYGNSGYDFNVKIPFLLNINQEFRLKSIIDTYKLAGKRYKIFYT